VSNIYNNNKASNAKICYNVNKAVYFCARFFRVNLVVCFDSILPKYTSALLFTGINPSSERHRECFVGCWSLMTYMAGRIHCNCPGLNNSLWWRFKLNIKKLNAILYKSNTYIFALRKTTQLTVNNILISILFDFRILIIWSKHPSETSYNVENSSLIKRDNICMIYYRVSTVWFIPDSCDIRQQTPFLSDI
jgi:hypothetical protein